MKINVPFLKPLIVTYPLYFAGARSPFGKDNPVSGAAAAERQINRGLLARRAVQGIADTYNNH